MLTGNWFFRRFPPTLCVIGAAAALWAWRSPAASWPERVWVFMALMSGAAACWGLARALRTRAWVSDQAETHPRADYSSAYQVAATHIVMHGTLVAVQVALLLFGAFAALTSPANPQKPYGAVSIALTLCLVVVELALTFLNYFLLYRQDRLIANVIEIGGD